MKKVFQAVLLFTAILACAQSKKVAPPNTCAQHVTLSPDGGLLVTSGTPTHPIVAFATATGTMVWKTGIIRDKAPIDILAFSSTGEYMIAAYRIPRFELLDATSGLPISTTDIQYPDGASDVAFSRDGSLFAVLTQADDIRVYSTSNWKETRTIKNAGDNGLAFSPDDAHIAVGLFSSEAKIWDVPSGKLIRTFTVKGGRAPGFFMDSDERQTKLWKAAWKVAFSPDGKKLATATDGYIQLWDVNNGTEIIRQYSGGRVGTLAFSKDGRRIGWATWNGELRIWDLLARRSVKVKAPTLFGEIAFSPDFSPAYIPDWKTSVRVIELPSGKQLSYFDCSTQ